MGIKTTSLNDISLYPNPAQELLIINCKWLVNEIQIYDILGRLMNTPRQSSKLENGEIQLDISNLASGMYFVNISNSKTNEKQIYKMVRR
jgi:hypothetical protein